MCGYFSAIAQVLIAIGLTYCSMIASGQTCVMSSQIFHRCGTVRRPRMMPPMPSVSAMVWRRPYFFGTSKSVTVAGLVAADLEGDDDEIGAVERLALVGDRSRPWPGRRASRRACRRRSRFRRAACGLMSIRRDLGAGQRRALQHVADDVLHEHGRAGADEGDLGIGRHGVSPFDVRRRFRRRRGRAAAVYSVLGLVRTSATGPCSTILPFCMTMTRWQRARTTLRSCEMKR